MSISRIRINWRAVYNLTLWIYIPSGLLAWVTVFLGLSTAISSGWEMLGVLGAAIGTPLACILAIPVAGLMEKDGEHRQLVTWVALFGIAPSIVMYFFNMIVR